MENNKPLVSIALCTYNGETFLHEQLDTLVNQTYPNLEIIALDDKSTDGTLKTLKAYQQKYPNIKVLENEKNLGYTKNFEKAIALCNGDFIALCDQDDVWALNKIALMVDKIDDHVLIYHDSQFTDSSGNVLNKKLSDITNFYAGDQPEAFIFFNCISSHAMLFHKSLIKEILPIKTEQHHDAWIAYIACNLGKIKAHKECLVNYRQHQSSTTDILKRKNSVKKISKNKKFYQRLRLIKCYKEFSKNKNPLEMATLHKVYASRQNKGFSFGTFFFFIKHFDAIFKIYKRGFWNKLNFMYKESRGIKSEHFNV